MNLEKEMEKLVAAAKTLFFAGQTPTFDGSGIGTKVYVEETREAADGNPLLKDGKWGVKVSETVRDMGDVVPELAQFTLAHELGHLVAPHLGEIKMNEVEALADLLGVCLLKQAGIDLEKVVEKLRDNDTLMFDEEGDWSHPPAKDRIDAIDKMRVALGKGTASLVAITEVSGKTFQVSKTA